MNDDTKLPPSSPARASAAGGGAMDLIAEAKSLDPYERHLALEKLKDFTVGEVQSLLNEPDVSHAERIVAMVMLYGENEEALDIIFPRGEHGE